MRTFSLNGKEQDVYDEMPELIDDSQVLSILLSDANPALHLSIIKKLTGLNDNAISNWLNISTATLGRVRKEGYKFKETTKEHLIVLVSVIKYGSSVLGSTQKLVRWLQSDNIVFDRKPPGSFLTSLAGIKFVTDKLTAIEYGDTV